MFNCCWNFGLLNSFLLDIKDQANNFIHLVTHHGSLILVQANERKKWSRAHLVASGVK